MMRGPPCHLPYSAVSDTKKRMPGDALLVHEVHDELQLVQALEVSRLGLVARLDQRFGTRHDERGQAAAEHYLLTEQVGLGLLLESRLEHARPCGSESVRVGERELHRLARGVGRYGDERGHAAALGVGAAHEVRAGPLGGDHGDVNTPEAG